MKRSKGSRSGTRKKLKKPIRKKGKISTARLIQDLKEGQRVVIKPEPAVQKAMPFRRFIGKTGTIKSRRGKSFLVQLKNGKKEKTIICRPVHLKRV